MRRIDPAERRANMKAYQKAYYERNSEKVKARSAAWMRAHPDAYRQQRYEYRLSRYGLTPDALRDHLVGQAGRCLVCLQVLEPGKHTHIDHDHATGKFRGLLCNSCNLMLGRAKDDPRRLRAGAAYLERAR